MTLVTNSSHLLEIESDFESKQRLRDNLRKNLESLKTIYGTCLYNRNARPTAPIDRVDPEEGTYFESYQNVKVKPEERLRVMMKRVYELRDELGDFDSKRLVRELDEFAVLLEERCLQDLRDYWDFSENDVRERYKRYSEEIEGREGDIKNV